MAIADVGLFPSETSLVMRLVANHYGRMRFTSFEPPLSL